MGILADSLTLFKREMLIFKSNLRVNIVRSIIFPFVIILFFGNIGASFRNTPIAVVNYANNEQSMQFISDLQINQVFSISSVTDEATALNLLQLGSVQIVVVVLPGFPSLNPSVPGVQIYYSNTQPTIIAASLPVIDQYAQHFGQTVSLNPGSAGSTTKTSTASSGSGEAVSSALYSASSNYIDFLVAGILGMVVVFSALFGGGINLLTDRQLGYIKAFLITPINKNAIVVSRIFSGMANGILAAALTLLIGALFGVSVAMGPVGYIYIAIDTALLGISFTCIAIALSSKVTRVDAFAIFSQAVGMPLWFIAGGITPASSLPSWLQPFTVIDPLTYSTEINRAVIMQGFISVGQLVGDMAVLIVFAAVMVLLAFKTFKSTIE